MTISMAIRCTVKSVSVCYIMNLGICLVVSDDYAWVHETQV